MRTTRLSRMSHSAAAFLPCLIVSLAVAACDPENEDDTGGASLGGSNEGGSGAGGSVGGEGGGDVPTVTVRTLDARSGATVENVPVVVSNADGSLVAAAASNTDGEVDVTIPPGGFVSVLWTYQRISGQADPALTTAREVRSFQPSADLELLEVSLRSNDLLTAAPMSLTFDVEPVEGAFSYELATSCDGFWFLDEGLSTEEGYWGCSQKDTFDVVLVARGVGGRIVDYAFQRDIPFVPGENATLTLGFSGAATAGVAFAASGVDADELYFYLLGMDDEGADPAIADIASATSPGAREDATLLAPTDFASRYCHSIQWVSADPGVSSHGEGRSACTDSVPDAFDFEGGRLRGVSIDVAFPTVSFTLAETGELGDGVELMANEVTVDGSATWLWWAVRDGSSSGSFVFPELPREHAAFAPQLDSTSVSVLHVDVVGAAGGFVQGSALTAVAGSIAVERETESTFSSAFVP